MDNLERLIRSAKPGESVRGMPLTERAKRDLERILAGTMEPMRQRLPVRRGPIYATVTFAVLVVLAAVALILPKPAAEAATPTLLVPTPVNQSVGGILQPMLAALATAQAPTSMEHLIQVQTWSLDVTDSGALPSVVIPEDVTIHRSADGARTLTSTAAQAYDANGRPVHDSRAPQPGTVTQSEQDAPGEYTYQFPAPPPETADALVPYLDQYAGVPAGSDPGSYFGAVAQLLMEWSLTSAQEAAVLRLLGGLDGVHVAGAVTDRLGREGIALEAPAVSGYQNLLVLSASTGMVLSFETIYVGSDRTDVPSPAVIAYYAWKEPNP